MPRRSPLPRSRLQALWQALPRHRLQAETDKERARVDKDFFAGTAWRSNFLINLGHGDPAKVYPRNPRLGFDTACRIE